VPLNGVYDAVWTGENRGDISCCFSCRIISYREIKMDLNTHAKEA
jgi:hypothetical protein